MSYILFSCNRYSVLYMFYKFYVHICMQKVCVHACVALTHISYSHKIFM